MARYLYRKLCERASVRASTWQCMWSSGQTHTHRERLNKGSFGLFSNGRVNAQNQGIMKKLISAKRIFVSWLRAKMNALFWFEVQRQREGKGTGPSHPPLFEYPVLTLFGSLPGMETKEKFMAGQIIE